MEIINHATSQLFDSIIEINRGMMTESLITIIGYLDRRMSKSNLDIITTIGINRMANIFLGLNPLLTSPFRTRIIEKIGSGREGNYVERMCETTFKDIFLTHIKSQDWHKTMVKNVSYTCEFHEESLFSHLIMASVCSVWYLLIKNPEQTDNYARFIAALALLHDIGKPCTMSTGTISVGENTKRVTKFNSHGLIGGLILQKAYSPDFGFGLEEWDTLCRCTSVHMCGYHCLDESSPITQSKWLRLSLETPDVKKGLLYLSVGDIIGNIRHDGLAKDQELFESRELFIRNVQTKLSEPSKIFTKLGTSGLVIVIVGASGAGKSTIGKGLVQYFTNADIGTTYISRDDIMLEMCCPILGIEVSQSAYSQCWDYAQTNSMGKEIDEQVKLRISNAISFGEVCIIDTVASMYRRVFNSYFSDDVLGCEILQIVVDRNIMHTIKDAERLGLSLERQIVLSGLSELMNPLAKIDNTNISGLGSAMETWNIKRDFSNRAQCTISTSVVWNSDYTFGLAHVYQILDELSHGMKKGIIQRINTNSMDITQYVNYIYGLYESEPSISLNTQYKLKLDALIRRFAVQQFVVSVPSQLRGTEYESRIFSIKYRDGINKLWRPVWARQCRGIFFYVQDDFTCVPIKYQLQRGAELMTGMLVSANIASTQDISDAKKIACLSDSQQRTCKILLTGENDGLLDAHLTEKVDGSLLTVTFYYGKLAELMKSIIINYGDDFSKMILTGFEKFGLVGVVSTQGTLMMASDMQDYFVTSNLESKIIGLKRDYLIEQAKRYNPVELFELHGESWFIEMIRVLNSLPVVDSVSNISLCWESVCENRSTAWGNLHSELAISYSSSMCLFLGASWSGNSWVLNIPHTMLEIESINEPRFWRTSTSAQVDCLMRGLEDVVYGRITNNDFLTKFSPSNKTWDNTLSLHPEGYVCYTREGTFKDLPIVDYNKLKLAAYYIGHKFHDESIKELYELSKTASHIFPMAKAVGDFYSEIESKFYAIGQKLSKGLGLNNSFASKLEGKAAKSYSSATPEIQAKMIINANTDSFNTWIKELVSEYYPAISTTELDADVVKTGLKRMCMDLKPWINYDVVPAEFREIIDDPIRFSGVGSVFLMLMHQKV